MNICNFDLQNHNYNPDLNYNFSLLKKNQKNLPPQEFYDQKHVQPFLDSCQDSNFQPIYEEESPKYDSYFRSNKKKMTVEDKKIKSELQNLSDENQPRIESPTNFYRISKYNNVYKIIYNYIKEFLKEWLELSQEKIIMLKNGQLWDEKGKQVKAIQQLLEEFNTAEEKLSPFKEKKEKKGKREKRNTAEKEGKQENEEKKKEMEKEKKTKQKKLLKKLDLVRFYFLNPLLELFEDKKSKRTIKKATLRKFLNKLPNDLNLKRTREKLGEDPKLGLFITSAILLFLESDLSNSTLINKQNAGLFYWMIKSPMDKENKDLFREMNSRTYIHKQYEKICLTLKETIEEKERTSELESLNDFDQKEGQVDPDVRYKKRPNAKRLRKHSLSVVGSEDDIASNPQKKVQIQTESAFNYNE